MPPQGPSALQSQHGDGQLPKLQLERCVHCSGPAIRLLLCSFPTKYSSLLGQSGWSRFTQVLLSSDTPSHPESQIFLAAVSARTGVRPIAVHTQLPREKSPRHKPPAPQPGWERSDS